MKVKMAFVIFFVFNNPVAASEFGSVAFLDPDHGINSITFEIKGDYAIAEGDIIIGRVSNLMKKNASIITRIGGKLWSQNLLPYEIDDKLPQANRLSVYLAINHMQEKTNIKFIELTEENRRTYVDYIKFVPVDGTGCSSFVGRQRGQQVIELSKRCNTMNTVHEICHALGLWHEQSRGDRDSFVRIVWNNIDDDHRFNFEQHLNNSEDFGEYDYSSIMHYPAKAFSKNGLPTIIPLKANTEIGQRISLSAKDIKAINSMYPEIDSN